MSDELQEELDYGRELARLLVLHLDSMGAGACTIPIILRDETYEVSVKRKPVTQIEL